MSNQGRQSTLNGRQLQEKCRALLQSAGHHVETEWNTGLQNALVPGRQLRADIYLPDLELIIECKAHSGQPGTLYQKIPYSFLTYRETRTPVVFLLGAGFNQHYWQVEALRKAAHLISPLIRIEVDNDCRTSAESESFIARLVSNRPSVDTTAPQTRAV